MSEGNCKEKAGFLFSHACRRPAEMECDSCTKAICAKHMREADEGRHCISCAKKMLKAGKPGREKHVRSARRERGWYDDDPYFYGPGYYHGYGYYGSGYWGHHHSYHGHDPHDFTEADGHATGAEGAEGFEHDMDDS